MKNKVTHLVRGIRNDEPVQTFLREYQLLCQTHMSGLCNQPLPPLQQQMLTLPITGGGFGFSDSHDLAYTASLASNIAAFTWYETYYPDLQSWRQTLEESTTRYTITYDPESQLTLKSVSPFKLQHLLMDKVQIKRAAEFASMRKVASVTPVPLTVRQESSSWPLPTTATVPSLTYNLS